VLHVINGEHYSGAERVQDLLAANLPECGFQVGFACVKSGKFPYAREATSAPIYNLPMRRRFDLSVVPQLVKLIREEGYTLVHAHTPRSVMVGHVAAEAAGVPLVYHVHSPASRDSTRWLQNWINDRVERRSIRTAARLIAVSESLKRHMIGRGVPEDRIVCVPNGVPCQPDAVPRQTPQKTWTLGTVALFRPRKGLEVLLQALAAARSHGHDVRLRAVGAFESPTYESAIMCLAERLDLGNVIDWVGFTRNVPAELARTDVFVLPSLFGEGRPMVVLEAMAMGLPVIASRVEGVTEIVTPRLTGLLVAPSSVNQLVQAINELITAKVDYTAMSRRGLERQREQFSERAMAAGVAQVYRDVLAARVTLSRSVSMANA
jgi:glycosyltransferase involved in cell wall biosynthesis